VRVGSNVTLRSLFPETIVTVRESGLQPELGIETTTWWGSPTERLILIGVVFPVSTPSTVTCAPVGKDVTFKFPVPFCPYKLAHIAPASMATRAALSFKFSAIFLIFTWILLFDSIQTNYLVGLPPKVAAELLSYKAEKLRENCKQHDDFFHHAALGSAA